MLDAMNNPLQAEAVCKQIWEALINICDKPQCPTASIHLLGMETQRDVICQAISRRRLILLGLMHRNTELMSQPMGQEGLPLLF